MFIKVAYGSTRVVVLTKSNAIKIMRPRPVRPFIRLFQVAREGRVKKQLQVYHQNSLIGGFRYMLAGLYANRKEYSDTQKGFCAEHKLAPVVRQFLWGVIVVQKRGESDFSDEMVKCHPYWPAMLSEEGDESSARSQFARFGDKILMVDFASPRLKF